MSDLDFTAEEISSLATLITDDYDVNEHQRLASHGVTKYRKRLEDKLGFNEDSMYEIMDRALSYSNALEDEIALMLAQRESDIK